MTHRELALGYILESLIMSLNKEMLRRDYVVKPLRCFSKKHYPLFKNKAIYWQKILNLAHTSFDLAKARVTEDITLPLMIKHMVLNEPWMIKKYKLNQKHIDKIVAASPHKLYEFRSLKTVNEIRKAVDEHVTHFDV